MASTATIIDFPPDAPSRAGYHFLRRQARPWLGLLQAVRTRSAKLGLECDIDEAWCEANWNGGVCALSGVPFVIEYSGTGGPKPLSPAIDRLDRSRGFTKDNCRFVCAALAHFRRGQRDDAALLQIVSGIYASKMFVIPPNVSTSTAPATAGDL